LKALGGAYASTIDNDGVRAAVFEAGEGMGPSRGSGTLATGNAAADAVRDKTPAERQRDETGTDI
jgi:diaminopimelate epimerase